MFIARLYRNHRSLAVIIPGRIWRGWRLKAGDRVVIEFAEQGRCTIRPLEVLPYDPVQGRRPSARRA